MSDLQSVIADNALGRVFRFGENSMKGFTLVETDVNAPLQWLPNDEVILVHESHKDNVIGSSHQGYYCQECLANSWDKPSKLTQGCTNA